MLKRLKVYKASKNIKICYFREFVSGDPEENRTPVTWMKTMDPDR